jgi:hypothetical protein
VLSRVVQHAAFVVGWLCMMAISLDEMSDHAGHDH